MLARAPAAKPPGRHSRPAGFTLLELLVAVALMASIAVLGWRGLDTLLRARAAVGADMARTRGMQLAFAQLQSDCEHLAAARLLPHRAPLVVTSRSLILVRTSLADGEPGQVKVVAYRLRGGVLSRRESAPTRDLRVLDALWSATSDERDQGRDLVLQSGLGGMQLRLWFDDGAGWRSPGLDVTPADAAPGAAAPAGLEVALQLPGAAAGLRKRFLLGQF